MSSEKQKTKVGHALRALYRMLDHLDCREDGIYVEGLNPDGEKIAVKLDDQLGDCIEDLAYQIMKMNYEAK